jgi:hypothetical protein
MAPIFSEMPDYQGIAILLTAVTNTIVSIGILVRQSFNKNATDSKLATLHELTNGQSEKLNEVSKQLGVEQGRIMGANEERAHSTTKEH